MTALPRLALSQKSTRSQAEAAREQAETERCARRSRLEGWFAHGVNNYPVTLVTDPGEIDLARDQLTGSGPAAYVVLRITGAGDRANVNLGRSLRQLIGEDGFIARRRARKAMERFFARPAEVDLITAGRP